MGIEVFILGTSYFSKVGLDGKYEISEILANTGYILCLQKGEQTQIIKENVEIIAGQNTVIEPVKFSKNNSTTTQITCNATERGILFEGCSISDTNIFITDKNNDVCMNINYKKPEWYHKWNYTYPLVKKDTEYDFYVRVERDDGFILEEQNFTVTAIGGLGEYKVENTDYEVTLSDDYVLSRTPQKFTNNKNVPILDYGTYYQIVSNDKNADTVWTDNTLWIYACDCWNSETQQKYDLHNSSWQEFSSIKSMLQGRALGAEVRTKVKIAGYTYNDTVTFSLNDFNQLVLPWKTENNKKEYKLLVVYGSDFGNFYTDVPNTKKYIISEDKSFVSAGTSGAREVYAQEVLISKNLEEPTYIPESFLGKWSAWTSVSEIYQLELSLPSSAWDIINYIIRNNPDTIISGTDGEYCPILLAPKN